MFRSHNEAHRRGWRISMKWVFSIFHAVGITFIFVPDVENTYTPLEIPGSSCQSLYFFTRFLFFSYWRKYFIFYLNKLCIKLVIEFWPLSCKRLKKSFYWALDKVNASLSVYAILETCCFFSYCDKSKFALYKDSFYTYLIFMCKEKKRVQLHRVCFLVHLCVCKYTVWGSLVMIKIDSFTQ